VLQNSHVRAVIARAVVTRNANMTVRAVGGCLIDLTTRKHESDQLSAFYPARRAFVFGDETGLEVSGSVEVVNGVKTESGAALLSVAAAGTKEKPALKVSYSLRADKAYLKVESEWTNTTNADLTLVLEDDLRADAGKEDGLARRRLSPGFGPKRECARHEPCECAAVYHLRPLRYRA